MKKFKLKALAVSITVLGLSSFSHITFADQQTVDQISQQLKVKYTIVDNRAADNGVDCSSLGASWGACNKILIELDNQGPAIESNDWEIYFHSLRQILKVDNEQFTVLHITGDLHQLTPTESFTGFPANTVVQIPLIGEYWQLFKSDVMPRWYVSSEEAKAKVIVNTNTEQLENFSAPIMGDQWRRIKDDYNILMSAEARFDKNQDVNLIPVAALRGKIIPTPMQSFVYKENADLSNGIKLISSSGMTTETQDALKMRFKQLGVSINNNGYAIKTRVDPYLFVEKHAVSGAYQLTIEPNSATIIGFDDAGAFYGVQSILSLIPIDGKKIIATLEVKDAPRFEYRGMFLDVARNFHSKEAVLRLLDQMAAYKLNKFHFHLSDNEGWRIEIPGLPELTAVGGQRCHDLSENLCILPQLGSGPDNDNMGSGYFSRDDYIEIVKYAKDRQIEVIPEIDMAAHARAAVIAMEVRYNSLHEVGDENEANEYRLVDPTDTSNITSAQFYDRNSDLNPCLDSSKRFADKIISEIAEMHNEAGQPLSVWHSGGEQARNIRLGPGYQDRNSSNKVSGKGTIDMSTEDKPWQKSMSCQSLINSGKVKNLDSLSNYFAMEISQLINTHGIEKMQAWQDGLQEVNDAKLFATKRTAVNLSTPLYQGGYNWQNKGYDVIVSNSDYLDLDIPYEVNPEERGDYWVSRFNDERKVFAFAPNNLPQNAETSVDQDGNSFNANSSDTWSDAFGVSGGLWSEVVRTDEQMEYMIYPRLLPLAERAWHRANWEVDYKMGNEFKGNATRLVNKTLLNRDWTRFANILGFRELAKLDQAGIAYRLPVPGAKISKGILEANLALPGLQIEYSVDDANQWLVYDNAKKPTVSGKVLLRSVSPNGKRFSRTEQLETIK